jgi:hypothetical protein
MVPLQVVPPCLKTVSNLSFSVGGWFIRKSHASHFMPKQNQREADAVTLAQTLGKAGIFRLTVSLSSFCHVLSPSSLFSLALEYRTPSNTPRPRALLALEHPSGVLSFVDDLLPPRPVRIPSIVLYTIP